MMGIVRAADGWLGINCLTGQHWLDVCAMLGLPEYGEQQLAIMLGGPERAEFFEKAQPWLSDRTVAEIVELSQAMRIPATGVNDGATALECPQYRDRGFFVDAGGDDWSFRRPGSAIRLSKTPMLPPRPAPRLGTPPAVDAQSSERWRVDEAADPAAPFAGSQGSRSHHVLGGRVPHLLSRCLRRRDRQSRIDTTARRPSVLGSVGPRG